MGGKFQGGIAKFIIIGIFGILIFSFAFTGFQSGVSFQGGVVGVASVDGNPIEIREYQSAVSQQVNFYSKMMGGKALSSLQIKQFGIKQTVLKRLIERKLIENLADELMIGAATKELSAQIKELPYFKTNDQFDVQKYKNLLKANKLSPSGFELNMAKDLKAQKVDSLLRSLKLASKNLANDIATFKESTAEVNAIEFSKESLRDHISISSNEVKKYLSDKKNLDKTQNTYDKNLSKYNVKAQINASHILIKPGKDGDNGARKLAKSIRKTLTKKNFKSIANTKTQDASGKGKGGALGWFGKGRMVKEFENIAFKLKKGQISQPVKTQFGYHIIMLEDKKKAINKSFKSVKKSIATTELRKGKDKELDNLFNKTVKNLESYLSSNSVSKIKNLESKYKLTFISKSEVNKIDRTAGRLTFDDEQITALFTKTNAKKVLNFSNALRARIVYVRKLKSVNLGDKLDQKKIAATETEQDTAFQKKLRDELMTDLESDASIVTNEQLL